MQAVSGVQSDSQADSCVRVMVSGQLCLRVIVKHSVVSQSGDEAVSGVLE